MNGEKLDNTRFATNNWAVLYLVSRFLLSSVERQSAQSRLLKKRTRWRCTNKMVGFVLLAAVDYGTGLAYPFSRIGSMLLVTKQT